MNRTQAKTKIWLVNDKEKPIMGEGRAALLKAINEEGSLKKRGGKSQGTFLTEKAIDLLGEYNTYEAII